MSQGYDNLTTWEKVFLFFNPFAIGTIKEDSLKALAEAKRRFPGPGLHNGRGDAFRHCYWSALLTRDVGVLNTLSFTDAHEQKDGQPPEEKDMDVHNNRRGIEIGIRNRKASDQTMADECEGALRSGRLKVLTP